MLQKISRIPTLRKLFICLWRGHKWGAIEQIGLSLPFQFCDECSDYRDLVEVDRCRFAGDSGQVEVCYMHKGWKVVDRIWDRYDDPTLDQRAAAATKGARVYAYGCDGAWFAMQPPKDYWAIRI